MNWKAFCKVFCKKLWKKNNMYLEHQTLGQWLVCPIDPAYDIEDCRIFGSEMIIVIPFYLAQAQ